MHVSLYQHHVHVLIQVKNNDRRGVDRFGHDGVGLTDLAMSMSSMWPRRVAGLQTVTSPPPGNPGGTSPEFSRRHIRTNQSLSAVIGGKSCIRSPKGRLSCCERADWDRVREH